MKPARALCLLLPLLSACTRPSGQDEAAAVDRMIEQRRAGPFEADTLSRNGAAMRTPPRGTVPADLPVRGSAQAPERALTDASARAFISAGPPSRVGDAGRMSFAIHCAACHGPGGRGESTIARNMTEPRPPSLLDERIRALSDSALTNRIVHGFGRMPPYASRLTPTEREAVVAFVRRLQGIAR